MQTPSAESPSGGGLVRGLGPLATTALVAGNIIGSGIFVIPASLALVAGPISLVAWLIVGVAYLALTAVFATLARAYPITGGLQIFTQRAFGNYAGLLTAFSYWISCVIGNAAYVTAFVGYLQVFFPALAPAKEAFLAGQALLWTLAAVNITGVRLGGAVQVVTTVLKVAPLVILSIALFAHGRVENLTPFAPHGVWALLPAISLVAWLFQGAESVTIPAEEVRGAGPTLRRAAYAGYLLAAGVYVLVGSSMALAMPTDSLVNDPSPLATAASRVLGPWGITLITLAALVSNAGILNGWLLVTGRLPFAAARQGFAPRVFSRLDPRTGTPVLSLAFSTLLTSALLLSYFSETLLDAYNLIALAASATALVAIGLACAASFKLLVRERERFSVRERRRGPLLGVIGIAVVALMIAGSGLKVFALTLVVIALTVPLYALVVRARRSAERNDAERIAS